MPTHPGVPHQKAVRALEKAGFRIARQGQQAVMRTIEAFLAKAG